ncbi:MAG TPA: MFS transporter [Natronosporangium sp.]
MPGSNLRRRLDGGRVLGGLPAGFWWLWAGLLVNRMSTFVPPFLVLYLSGPRGMPMSAVGQVLVLHGAGALLSRFLGGWLADRFGRRATMAGGLAATAASTVGLAYAHQLLAITAAG